MGFYNSQVNTAYLAYKSVNQEDNIIPTTGGERKYTTPKWSGVLDIGDGAVLPVTDSYK